jgi:hypothetical protein
MDCTLPRSVKGFHVSQTIVDQHGHALDGDHDPLGKDGCEHRDTPEWQAAYRREQKMEQTQEPLVENEPPPLLASNDPAATPAPAALTETVGVDSAIQQVKTLVPDGTDPGLLIAGAATLAVVGAAVKFGPQVLKSRAEKAERDHELEMERLKLEREKHEKQEDQHKACAVERAALEAKVVALQSKLDEVAAKAEKAGAASLNMGDFDPEDLQDRLAKIEKALKPTKGKKKA